MSLTVQFETMLAVFGLGIFLGMLFDAYLRFVRKYKMKTIRLFFYDVFFWIIYSIVFFYVLLNANEGELRFYLFLANLCGFSCYQALFRKYFLNFLELFIRFMIKLSRILQAIFSAIVIKPIRLALHLLAVFVMIIWKIIYAILKFLRRLVVTPLSWMKKKMMKRFNKNNNEKGFLKKFKNIFSKWSKKDGKR